jgi:hypothetical protein
MNVNEFSNEFDVLYNNIMSNAAPGLNEYEKSVLLTKAQEEIVKNYFEPAGNKYGKGLDDSPKRQIDFSELIKVGQGVLNTSAPTVTFDKRAKVYDLPADLFLVINEAVDTNAGTEQIVPISYSDYTRLMSRPYKEPVKYQAWRIIAPSINNISVELIVNSNETITDYKVRYIRRPAPIITTNLSSEYGDVTINGVSTVSECELNPIIHSEILQRAVELAKAAYQGDLQASVELGQRSE